MSPLNLVYQRSVLAVLIFGSAFLCVAGLSFVRDGRGMFALIRGDIGGSGAELTLNDKRGLKPEQVPALTRANEELALIHDLVSPSVVSITAESFEGGQLKADQQGSGVIVTKDGYVVTNFHVIAPKSSQKLRYHVELADGTLFDGVLVGADPVLDVALLKVEGKEDFEPIAFGDSDALDVGHRVFAFGNPYRLGVSFSEGNVAAKDRFLNEMQHDLLQITAPLNPGQSGGPLVNVQGQLVGLNSSIYSRDEKFPGFQGIAFSIRGNEVKEAIFSILKGEKPVRGYLGVTLGKLNNLNRRFLDYPKNAGTLIYSVAPDSPATKAGLKKGDIVMGFDGKKIAGGPHLISLLKRHANKEVKLRIWRDKKEVLVPVTLSEQGQVNQQPTKITQITKLFRKIGITPEALTTEELSKGRSGVRVSEVEPDSLAEQAGIRVNDYIILINGSRVTSVRFFLELLRSSILSRQTDIRIERPGEGTLNFRLPKQKLE